MYKQKEFTFSFDAEETHYTDANKKPDDEKNAYVTVTKANLDSSSVMVYVVTNTAKSKEVSASKTFIGENIPNKEKLKYKSGYGKKNSSYRLRIISHIKACSISGRWNS